MKASRLTMSSLAISGIAIVWLKLLPMWAESPNMRAALKRHEQAGINGGAIYYSENPAALEAVASIREIQVEAPHVFWRTGPTENPRDH